MTPNSSAAFVARRALPRDIMLADAGCLFIINDGLSALQLSYAGCPPRVGATRVLGADRRQVRDGVRAALSTRCRCGVCALAAWLGAS
jgi:hypothetical protein